MAAAGGRAVITGLLVVVLLALREAFRLRAGHTRLVPLVDRLLVPASIGLVVVLAVRTIELAARGA